MDRRHVLVTASAAQLVAGVAGRRVAVREGRSFDIALIGWRGQRERIARDSWLLGTGLSAPVIMLAIQAAATARLIRSPSRAATRTLGLLGAAMSCGYLIEKEFRTAMSPTRLDPVTTPVATAGFGLAVVMAVTGLRSPSRPG
jgi:hypothetical protein